MTVGLLLSGNLGYLMLNNLFGRSDLKILFVFTDRQSLSIIQFCEKNKIPFFAGNPRGGKASSFLNNYPDPELILSINYLFIVEQDLIDKASGYAINIHGSLLPKYRGRTPHVWAIINNEKTTGITAHLITNGCDEGDIVLQKEILISDNYTGQDLLNIFNEEYPLLVDQVILLVNKKLVTPLKQNHAAATYFGKRTAEDGKINFNWHKERIYNWVRAQARPYPGAFCFSGTEKVSIHKISFTDLGFHDDMINGAVIKTNGETFFIKTPNGVIEVLDWQANSIPQKGTILS